MTTTPTCKQCKWARPNKSFFFFFFWFSKDRWKFATCTRTEKRVDPVTAEVLNPFGDLCSAERMDYGYIYVCGSAGKYWQPRPGL